MTELKTKEKLLLQLTSNFCKERLDESYLVLCTKIIENLSLIEPAPYLKEKIELWAAGIIHALGSNNFLFIESNEHYVEEAELCAFFELKKSKVSSKSKFISRVLSMQPFGSEYSVQRIVKEEIPVEKVLLDGILVNVDTLPGNLMQYYINEKENGGEIEIKTEDLK